MKRFVVVLPALLALSPACSDLTAPTTPDKGGDLPDAGNDGAGSHAEDGAGGLVTGDTRASSPCDPSYLMAEGLSGDDLAVEAKYRTQPPLAQSQQGDNVAVPKERAIFLRQADYAFSGELLDPPEGLGPNDTWDKAHVYTVRVDVEYWSLGDAPLPPMVSTTVIGWIPPKPGRLYFWATGSYHAPTVLNSYVAAEPRTAWFCPTAGLYRCEISSVAEKYTECPDCGDGSDCVTFYSVAGQISETLMGRIATGQPFSFTQGNVSGLLSGAHSVLCSGVVAEGGLSVVDPALGIQRTFPGSTVATALGCSNP